MSTGVYRIEGSAFKEVTGMDYNRNMSAGVFPISENEQYCIVNNYVEYTTKVYHRKRDDKDSPWSEWELKGIIDNL